MRTLALILFLGLTSTAGFNQEKGEITEKRNIYNKKGDYYLDRNDYGKAIVFYNMAYRQDKTDYFSILKKADAYTKLKLYPHAETCYRIVFDSPGQVDNSYRLKYAFALLNNNKQDEFKEMIGAYSKVVADEIQSDNYLISSEKRLQLYKDTAIVLKGSNNAIDSVKFKIKYAGYKPRKKTSPEDNMLNVLVSSGEDYNIAPSATGDFKFSFQPKDNYKLIIQREDISAEAILESDTLTPEQKKGLFLNPPPVQKAEIIVPLGMKYDFSVGQAPISSEYLNALNEKAKEYQDNGESTIDLTALAKDLQLSEGEIYTVRFVKDDSQSDNYKKFEISDLFINDRVINIFGQTFLVVLPFKAESSFNIQTNLDDLEENYSPKKHTLVIDNSPVFQDAFSDWLIPLTLNTKAEDEVLPANRLSAKEISIIPSTVHILTLSKTDFRTGRDIEVIVPLSAGVKYNLSSSNEGDAEFKESLAEFLIGREGLELANEEVIDISVLSKELEVKPGEDLSFHLLPAKQYGPQPKVQEQTPSILTVDGKSFDVLSNEKYAINISFGTNHKVNLRTALDYVTENFEANSYTLLLDTISFTSEIAVDTAGYNKLKSSGWLSMSVNTKSIEEVEKQFQLMASEVSIIPGKEYILTVSKLDAETGKEEEIIVPLIRKVKYDFTANPTSEEEYKQSLESFLAGREDLEAIDGTVIDITLISKELQIEEGDVVSFSLLPAKVFSKQPGSEPPVKSSLFLDDKVVEFTQIQKYTINMPLGDKRQMNMQTNIEHILENFSPESIAVDIDTLSFFSEIAIDTAGLVDRIIKDEEITDPVFDVVVVNFNLNEDLLLPDAKKTVQDKVIKELKADTRLYVTIKGYTDALGDADYNFKLSKRRAESVKVFLESDGIGENRIRTFSFGESEALKEGIDWEDLNEEELKKHRKVEIVIYVPE